MVHFRHARGAALVARLAVFGATLAMAACVAAADGFAASWWWLLVLGVPGVFAAALPDSNTGLLVVALLMIAWARGIDGVGSAYVPVVGVLLAVFHVSMASAAAAPGAARWTAAMTDRYVRRLAGTASATVVAWVMVVGLREFDLPGRSALVVAAFTLAAGGLWARGGRVRGRP